MFFTTMKQEFNELSRYTATFWKILEFCKKFLNKEYYSCNFGNNEIQNKFFSKDPKRGCFLY